MNTETISTMDGHFAQDNLDLDICVKPCKTNVVTLSSRKIPKWYSETAESIYSILALSDNWDSYGANRFSQETAKAVDNLLRGIMHMNTPAPQLVPSASGTIQLEWHVGGIDLEIEVESLSTSYVFFEDEKNQEPLWEGEIKYDLSKLVHYINILTERVTLN
ncbi:MAG: hypothetical protein QM479_07115 [Pseudomonadota bacterium]